MIVVLSSLFRGPCSFLFPRRTDRGAWWCGGWQDLLPAGAAGGTVYREGSVAVVWVSVGAGRIKVLWPR